MMKGFGARDASGAPNAPNVQVGDVPLKSSEACPSKITIPGKRAPLDLTLKTTLQFVSSSSVKWWVGISFSCISFLSSKILSLENALSPNEHHVSLG
jgi:hypothetical protein